PVHGKRAERGPERRHAVRRKPRRRHRRRARDHRARTHPGARTRAARGDDCREVGSMSFRIRPLVCGLLALALLAALQIAWHALLEPAPESRFWPTLLLAVAPLLPGLWVARHNARRGVLIGGIVGL